jgi:hypothetical protein
MTPYSTLKHSQTTLDRGGAFQELQTFDFGVGGISQFRFQVVDLRTGMVPSSIEPFTFGVTFESDGVFSVVKGRRVVIEG